MTPPDIATSTAEQRADFVEAYFHCMADCDMCGHCQFLHGRSATEVYADYIAGKQTFMEVTMAWRRC